MHSVRIQNRFIYAAMHACTNGLIYLASNRPQSQSAEAPVRRHTTLLCAQQHNTESETLCSAHQTACCMLHAASKRTEQVPSGGVHQLIVLDCDLFAQFLSRERGRSGHETTHEKGGGQCRNLYLVRARHQQLFVVDRAGAGSTSFACKARSSIQCQEIAFVGVKRQRRSFIPSSFGRSALKPV